MTNELEKQFFDTFGIEPRPLFSTRNGYTDDKYIYPTITDSILLELICISKQATMLWDFFQYRPSVEELKNNILENMLNKNLFNFKNKDIKHQVRTLFEEG